MSIASAIFSESQSRLYRWLFGHPQRSFHLSELARLTGLGSASLQREVKRLESAGLIASGRVGNLRRIQANPESPVYGELVALTAKTLGIVPSLAEALAPLRPRLKVAWVFGSVASGSDHASSDIDLMVVADRLSLREILEQIVPLESKLGRKIAPTVYTTKEFLRRRAEPDSFVNRVLVRPTVAVIGETDELAGAR